MINQVPFIDREEELALIDTAINEWGTQRIICIQAEGGIGKTRLLQEVRERYLPSQSSLPLLIMDIIDFYDHSIHDPMVFELEVARMLGKEHFEPYYNALYDWRSIRSIDVSQELFDRQGRAVDQKFFECFNQVSAQKRIVMLWDTTEVLKDTEAGTHIFNLVTGFENTVILISGRDARTIGESFEPNTNVNIIDLSPLKEGADEVYLEHKQELLYMTLDPELAQKLLFLAEGKPILIDLAIDWLSREVPLSWLVEKDLAELTRLAGEEKKIYHNQFKLHLVHYLAEVRHPIDRLILLMAWIHPIDREIIQVLLSISGENVDALFAAAQGYAFVKTLPDGRITLHDEMRDMVNEYVWPEIDPDKDRRRRDSRLFVAYLDSKIQQLTLSIQQRQGKEENARRENKIQLELELSIECEALERQVWVLQEQELEHSFVVDPEKGIGLFIQMFDMATQRHRLIARDSLVAIVQKYTDVIPQEQIYAVESRKITHLTDKAHYESAVKSVDDLLNKGELEPGQKIHLLTQKANSHLLLGDKIVASEEYEEALQISKQHPELLQLESRILNNLGRVSRMRGYYPDALRYYKEALTKATDRAQTASILNDIGYVTALDGDYRSALTYCERALMLRQQLNLSRGIGASFSTLGEVYRNWGAYDEALNSYNRALEIFEPAGDPLWLARLYSYRGAIYRLQSKFQLAESELNRSIEQNVLLEQPWAYHVLGCVFWNWDAQLDKALEYFERSDTLADEVHDTRNHVNNLVGFAEVYYAQWQAENFNSSTEYPGKIQEKVDALKKILEQKYSFPHHYGRMLRVVADVAFEQEDYEKVLVTYAEAYALLGGRLGGYGRRTFAQELDLLVDKIKRLATRDKQLALDWYRKLREYWSDENRHIMRRNELISVCDINEIDLKWQIE
ncbi:MAG: ATP-binding protein [Anaerolineae bacterium]|nr:ATP-binding protein [Anaerolineae bacterium]